MTKETFSIARGKIIVTTYGKNGSYPATHIAMGIRDAKANLAQIEASTRNLSPSTVARRDVLRKAIAAWDSK